MSILLERRDLAYTILGIAPVETVPGRICECGYRVVGQIDDLDPEAFRWCGWQPVVDAHAADYGYRAIYLNLEGSLKKGETFTPKEKARLEEGLADLLVGTSIDLKEVKRAGIIDNLKQLERISGDIYLVTHHIYGQGGDSIKQWNLYFLAEGDTLYTENIPPPENNPFPKPKRVKLFWRSPTNKPTLIANEQGPIEWKKIGSLRDVSRVTLSNQCHVTRISEHLLVRLQK